MGNNTVHYLKSEGIRILSPTKESKMNFLGIYTRINDRVMVINCSFQDEPEIECEIEIDKEEEQVILSKFLANGK